MNKILIGAVLMISSLMLVGCGNTDNKIDQATSLAEILSQSTEIQMQYDRGDITLDQLNEMTQDLQKKYEELTLNDTSSEIQKDVGEKLDQINTKIINAKKLIIPAWASNLGINQATGLTFVPAKSRQTTLSGQGYDSITLVYSGDYSKSMDQAAQLAAQAHISISPEFQAISKSLSGETNTGNNIKGIVYSNHGLLDTNIEFLVTISVDEKGELTMEAINYKQMENR